MRVDGWDGWDGWRRLGTSGDRSGLAGGRRLGAVGRGVLVAVTLWLGAPPGVEAQQVIEYGPQVIGIAADPASAVAGGYAAIRTLGRTRFALTAGAGVGEGGEAAWRAELAAHFLLNPRAQTGVGAYVGGGAAVADGGGGTDGYLLLLAGIESSPGQRSGWALEAGLGGGLRIAAGWRWRSFPPNWRFRR